MSEKDKLINELLNSGKLNSNAVRSAAKGDAQAVLNSLSDKDAQKVSQILNDEQAMKKLLSSKQAQSLLNILFKDGKNNG